MTERLPLLPWMTAPETAAVLDALEAAGGAGCARFVGGCVRDSLLRVERPWNRDVLDIDIATTLEPTAVVAALEAAALRAVPTGIAHGTVTAISRGRPFEVTTTRRDVETDGRHALVAFTDDWAEDAARRDFRLNALYAERDGSILDPTGHGVADARAGRVVFVGDPDDRIAEDYLRILRFFRFHAGYGRGEPDAAGLEACGRLKAGLAQLSAERVAAELLKLLAVDDPRPAVRAMAGAGVLEAVLPGAALGRFDALVEVETSLTFEADAVLRLGALLPDERGVVQAAARRLKLSNADRKRERLVAACSTPEVEIISWMSPREMRRAIHAIGGQAFKDRAKLAWAADGRTASAPQWRLLTVYPDTWTPPPFPLSGEQIKAAGVPEGPMVGRVRREIERWWIDLDFTDDAFAALERLKAVAQGLVY